MEYSCPTALRNTHSYQLDDLHNKGQVYTVTTTAWVEGVQHDSLSRLLN